MEQVFIVVKKEVIEYSGVFETIMGVFKNNSDANAYSNELTQENHNTDIEYSVETYQVK